MSKDVKPRNSSILQTGGLPAHTARRFTMRLLGEEWMVGVCEMDGDHIGEIDHDTLTVTIDAHANFRHTLHHEVCEYLLEEFGCHYGNYDGDHKFIMTHTQMDLVVRLTIDAVDSLRECAEA